MVEQVLVTILVWVAVLVCWHRAIEDVRSRVSPLRNVLSGITMLVLVFIRASSWPSDSGAILLVLAAGVLAIILQLWMIFLVGKRASEEG